MSNCRACTAFTTTQRSTTSLEPTRFRRARRSGFSGSSSRDHSVLKNGVQDAPPPLVRVVRRRSAVQLVPEAVQHVLEYLCTGHVGDRPIRRRRPVVRGLEVGRQAGHHSGSASDGNPSANAPSAILVRNASEMAG